MSDPSPEFVKALEDVGLLQDEYPDQMAARSCTCTEDAVCGAHRLLARYEQLFAAFQESNREKRARGTRVSTLRRLAYELAHGNRPQLFEGRLHWYSPDENGQPHFLNAPLTDGQIAEWEAIQEMET